VHLPSSIRSGRSCEHGVCPASDVPVRAVDLADGLALIGSVVVRLARRIRGGHQPSM
jgi:hypothetical protein